MIWDNFSIFRTNCAIECGTRAYMLRGFLRMSRGGNDVRLILLAHNRQCLLEFCFSIFVVSFSSLSEVIKTVSKLVMSCFIYHWPSYVPLLLLQELHITSLQVSHSMLKNNSFSLTQQKHYSWIYLDTTAFQDFKVSLLLPHACEEFVRLYHDRKVKKIIASLSSAP